jgi:hypothetical protein
MDDFELFVVTEFDSIFLINFQFPVYTGQEILRQKFNQTYLNFILKHNYSK